MPPEKLHTPAEAAAILGISVKTLREHVRTGRICSVVVGCGHVRKRRRFTNDDINEFIRASEE